MSIESHELAQLLRQTLPGALSDERRNLEIIIDTIERDGITACSDSEHSIFLQNAIEQHRPILIPKRADYFSEAEIYGVDVPVVNAVPLVDEGRRQIVVFDGILQIIRFYADLMWVLNLLMSKRSDRTFVLDEQSIPEANAFSMAAFSILADFVNTRRTLIALSDILGPNARHHALFGYAGAVAFVLAHESGHLALGHTGFKNTALFERNAGLAIKEDIGRFQQLEFDADAYALESIREEIRPIFVSNALIFLGPTAFLEAFGRQRGGSHPLATNRAFHLLSLIAYDPDTATQVKGIIESQVLGFKQLESLRQENGGDIRHRIHERMPIEVAHEVVRMINERVKYEIGLLDIELNGADCKDVGNVRTL
jgi:hypothetical protein